MPMGGRSRTNKRSSSSSSYTSTITVIAFIAVCVIGVWMMTSTSVAPPQTTTSQEKISTATEVDTSESNEVQTTELAAKKTSAVFEDNPGDLPADAIKSDEPKSSEESESDKKETDGDGGGAIGEKGTGSEQENSQDEVKGKDLSAEEKQAQISEESTMTQTQQAEQVVQESSSESQGNQEETNQSQDQKTSSSDQTTLESQDTQNPDNQNQQQEQKDQNPDDQDQQQEQKDQNPDEQNQQQEQKDQEEIGSNKKSSKHSSVQKQQEEKSDQSGGTAGSGQDPQNLKSYEAIQQKQRLEDAGVLTGTNSQETSQNVQVPADDQKNIVQQQQQEKPQKQQQQPQTKTTTATTTTTTTLDQDKSSDASFPGGGVIPKESKESKKSWSTQAAESENQKERRKDESDGKDSIYGYTWQLCNVTAGPDYIPCLDNEKALRQLRSTKHFEHRERHCPEERPSCLVPIPEGYKRSILWPQSRDKIWYHNVPHTKLAEVKGHQNWVKVTGEFLTFPGGGTQFIHGALDYIDFVQETVSNIAWGKRTRVILDVGCGVASFGGYLFEKDVLTMSFAPKDEHEAQVQFALERGIPAISAVMGSQRLPFPSMVFDLLHCARCRVPWHAEGGLLLLELNRVLRPGGYFVWSATPVYQKLQEDVEIWEAMSALTASMCWELVTIQKDKLNSVGAAIYRKPSSNDCYDQRKQKKPPMCKNDDDPNAAWYVPLQACMHRVPVDDAQRGSKWPEEWPSRLQTPPYWLNSSQMGIYGKPAPQDFSKDYEHWKHVVSKTYLKNMGISWSNVRNVMDMRAVYGGFAAALKDLQVWVMNVVNIDSPDTLPIIYERGLFGIYHDWCESFSTYPRSYDLLHADHLFSVLRKRCKLTPVLAEIDRMVRPGGKLIVRDESSAIGEVENLLKSLRWEVHLTFSKDQEGLLSAQKGDWRPQTHAASS